MLTASQLVQVNVTRLQVAFVPSAAWQVEFPALPGQHGVAPAGFGMHDWLTPPGSSLLLQHMSVVGLGVQVPGAPPLAPGSPVHAAATHSPWVAPAARSHTGVEPPHCESAVHAPHVFGVVAPQMGVLPEHCPLPQQLPGVHAFAVPPVAQQMSLEFTQALPGFVQEPGTQTLVVVLQISVGP